MAAHPRPAVQHDPEKNRLGMKAIRPLKAQHMSRRNHRRIRIGGAPVGAELETHFGRPRGHADCRS